MFLRHGGIIPWDDDIDVALDAKKADKVRSIIENTVGGRIID